MQITIMETTNVSRCHIRKGPGYLLSLQVLLKKTLLDEAAQNFTSSQEVLKKIISTHGL